MAFGKTEKREIKIEEEVSDDYRLIPCNTFESRIDADSMVKIDISTETGYSEGDESLIVGEDGYVIEKKWDKELNVVKTKRMGILTTVDAAFTLACMLISMLFEVDPDKVRNKILDEYGD